MQLHKSFPPFSQIQLIRPRSSHWICSIRKADLKKFTFTFLIKLRDLWAFKNGLACARCFFHQMIALNKFIPKRFFCSQDVQIFAFAFPSFFSLSAIAQEDDRR